MASLSSLEGMLIGKREDVPYEVRIINIIVLAAVLISVFKIVMNALLLDLFEVAVATLCAAVAGACYLHIRKTQQWKRLAIPACALFLVVMAADWIIDPFGVLSDDGYNFIVLGVIAAIIFKPRQVVPFVIALCIVVAGICAKSLVLPGRALPDGKALTIQMADTGLTLVLFLVALVAMVSVVVNEHRRVLVEMKRAHDQIKVLKGLLPICARCKKIRDDEGEWKGLESYITRNSEASFTHTYCPECSRELLDEFYQLRDSSPA